MSLPHAPHAIATPSVSRTVPMRAMPGSPLEPLRHGRRLDRRYRLLAGLLGIAGVVVDDGAARGQLVLALGSQGQVSPDVVILRTPVLRALVNAQTVVLSAGIVGWILASGARWWAWLAVLLTPMVGAAGYGLVFAGVDSGFVSATTGALSLAVALVTLLLTLARKR